MPRKDSEFTTEQNVLEPEVLSSMSDEELRALAAQYRQNADRHRNNAKGTLRSFLMTGVFVVAIVAVFIGIMAWFTNNQEISATGMTVNTFAPYIGMEDCELFIYSSDEDKYKRYTFTDLQDRGEAMPIEPYDALMSDNSKAAMYIRCPVKSENFMDDDVTGMQYTIFCSKDAKWTDVKDDQSETRYLSSITKYNCATLPSVDKGDIPSDKTSEAYAKYFYEAVNTAFHSGTLTSRAQTFTTISDSTVIYANYSLSFNLPREEYEDGITKITSGEGAGGYMTYVYFEIDYSPELVEQYLCKDKNGKLDLGGRTSVHDFYSDLLNMQFTLVRTSEETS